MGVKIFNTQQLRLYNSDGTNSFSIMAEDGIMTITGPKVSIEFEKPFFTIGNKGPWITVSNLKEELQFHYAEIKEENESLYDSEEELISDFKKYIENDN